MGDMFPPKEVLMVPTFNGAAINYPAYIIDPERVDEFKAQFDNVQPGLVYMAYDEVSDLRGPRKFPKK